MKITLKGHPGVMACDACNIPGFGPVHYTIAYPEAIGDAAQPVWYSRLQPVWAEEPGGAWICRGELEGELRYALTLTPGEDCVTSRYRLTNLSTRTWSQGMAFNCLQCAWDPAMRDNECLRTWVRSDGQFRRLVELPRVFGPRPALQLYSVEGAPPGRDIPFVANFQSTPDVVIEPWMAIVARDGRRLVATVSRPGLFLFQNREFSCIHCATGFGPMPPGHTATAVNKVYFVEADLAAWHRRMQADFDQTCI